MILSYQSIKLRCTEPYRNRGSKPLIDPYCERTVLCGMSHGLSVAGYDFRIKFDEALLNRRGGIPLAPGGFVLATTVERFVFPDDLIGFVKDKSSWARQGLALQNTVIEPGWEGYVTLELSNHSPEAIWIYDRMPIGQMIFQKLDFPTEMPYSGKYQNQEQKAVPAKMEGT